MTRFDWRILILDSNDEDVKRLVSYLHDFGDEYGIRIDINNIKSVVEARRISKKYHFLLMDLDINNSIKNAGIDLAHELSERNSLIRIIYITNNDELVYDAYCDNAIAYLKKPLEYLKLKHVLLNQIKRHNELDLVIDLGRKSKDIIYSKDIIKIEASNHRCLITMIDNSQKEVNMSLVQFEKKLVKRAFQRINRYTIINMIYVDGVDDNHVIINGCDRIKISQTYRKKVEEFICE